jgi:hypothetical protein
VERIIDAIVTPVVAVIVGAVEHGLAFVIFIVLWLAFGAALIWSQGSLDATWEWVRSMPLILQGLLWLLFLPVVAGLWVWETTWPLVVRLVLIVGLAGWSLLIFLPRAMQSGRP